MKLKFRAEKKDWIMFGIYAVILLYFVAIAILNLAQFASGDIDHPFHGFNPLPAFEPSFLGITIVLYIIALVASILSVSDRFFDMEKGLGFSTESKKEKGYSRWLEEKELKRQKDIEMVNVKDENAQAGGIPLINDGKRMWVDNGEGHNIIIGSTGAGKTQITMFPLIKSLAKHDESMIITDPKGELYEGTSEMLKKRGYNVVILNFRDPQRGSGWNPLHLPYQYYKEGNKDKAQELVEDLAINILVNSDANNQDPFWENTSADYFSGICLGLFEDAKEDEINLNSVNAFTTTGEEKSGPNSTFVNEYFNSKGSESSAYIKASSTIVAPNETKGSILSVFKEKLTKIASRENISEMLSHSDFELKDIGKKKTAVFIVIQDEKTTYHSLVTIFVKQCYEALVDYAQSCGGKLPYRTNFLLDEFANMPKLNDIVTMVSAARSRKMRFFFVIQNFAQLSEKYGKNVADTIRGNCTNTIYLISSELAALEEISKMCGETKVKSGKGDKAKEETRPLITVSDLQKLKEGEVIILRSRLDPFRTKVKLDWQMDWGELFKTAPRGNFDLYPQREKEPVHIFDLKGYVGKKKEERINEIIGNSMNKQNIPNIPNMTPKPRKTPNINYNEMIKRIDARIAELEAMEQEEKEKVSKSKVTQRTSVPNVEFVTPVPMTKEMKEIFKNNEEKPKNIEPVETKETVIVKETPKEISVEEKVKETIKKEQVKEKPNKKDKPKKEEKKETPKEEPAKPKIVHEIGNKKELADKITNNINKNVEEPTNNYITDDQFFDDFFTDDEE